MLQPVFTVPIFAVHGLLDGARGKGLATPEWLEGVLGARALANRLLELEESRVTVEQFNALFIAVKDSLNDECLGYLHGRPMRPGSVALMVRSAFSAHSLSFALRRLGESFALLQDDVGLVPVTEGTLGASRWRCAVARARMPTSCTHICCACSGACWCGCTAAGWCRSDSTSPCAAAPCDELRAHLFRHAARRARPPGSTPMPLNSRCGAIGTRCSPSCAPRRATWWAYLNERSASARVRMVRSGPARNGPTWSSPRSACTCR